MVRFIENEKERKDFTFTEIKKSFCFHYQNCDSFRAYCDMYHFTPDSINTFEDLYMIPQITTTIFKSMDVLSKEKRSCKCCTSSGTKGVVSRIYRDKATVRAFLDSVYSGLNRFYDMDIKETVILNLGCDKEEAGDVWLAYVTGFLNSDMETRNFVHSGILETQKLVETINDPEMKKRILLLGPPTLFLKVFEDMEKENIKVKLPENAVVITAGGWKNKSNISLSREEFLKKLNIYFE